MSRSTDLIGRVLSGRYRLIAPIGAGASAQVFLADDVRLKRRVAVKLLHAALADDDTFLRRFRAEAQAAAALNHPNIVAVYDWGDDDGELPYIVTEYLGGGSLRSVLDQGVRLTPSQALLVGLETSRALDYAHRRGFVHRDIKPANLLFGEDGRLRIADFGLARALAEAAWTEPQGAVLGTARYASPEQAQGEAVDGRADVYSLGLVLIEAVTGAVPFSADTTIATLMGRVGKQVEVPPALGPLVRPLERAGRPSPADRADAAAFGASLMALAEELPRPQPLPLVAPPTLSVTAVADAGDQTLHGTDPDLPEHLAELDWEDEDDERRPRRRWPLVLLALLLVAGGGTAGALAYERTSVERFPVPTLIGLTREEAEDAVAEYGFQLDVDEIRKDGSTPGQIIETDPPAAEDLKEGGTVKVLISLGNQLADIPGDLVGLSIEDATAALQTAGQFVAVPQPVDDESVPEGKVIRLGDGVPTQLPKGSEVPLVVSGGPAPRTVPNGLVGGTYEAAVAGLQSVQLKATKAEEFSDTVAPGVVIRLDPGQGAKAERDSTVKVVVSKGPELIKVPDVNGKTIDQAVAAIEAAGLTAGDVQGRAGGTPFATDPPAGQSVRKGTTVDIFIRR